MAVVPMKRVLIAAMRRDRKPILELLQRTGALEIHSEVAEDGVFSHQDMSGARATFESNAKLAADAAAVLDAYVPGEGGLLSGLEGREELSLADYSDLVSRQTRILQDARRILALDKDKREKEETIPKLESQLVALAPWAGFDLPLNFAGTRTTAAFTGTLPGELTLEQVSALMEETGISLQEQEIQVISTTPEQTAVFLICEKKEQEKVKEALRKLNFARPMETSVNPAQAMEDLKGEIQKLRSETESIQKELCAMANCCRELHFLQDYFRMRADKYGVISELAQTRRVFLVEGYVPAAKCEALEEKIVTRFDAVFETYEPSEEEDVPVLLQNNGFASPVESVVESYSMPGKGELDPSMLVACFYYILFGLMLSDAAYGLIMVIGCAVALHKVPRMEEGMKKTLKMFLYCGISTTVCGFLFGSFFGDAVNVIATTFFHRPDISLPAIWFEPIDKPMKMLVFCFAVALIHLFVGLGAKFYMCVKDGKILDGIYDVVFWYLLVGGAVVYLLTMPMFTQMLGLSFTMPASAGKISAVIAIAAAVGIILTSGRESKSWFKRILKGLYGVYGVTSYLSDILSYSRLLALGLATSVISSVFNKMGSMLGDSVFGVIVFILVFVVGHSLNLAINALGAYVHTNRLTFVEFFGKFYEGGGRKFAPFTEETSYFTVKEEIKG